MQVTAQQIEEKLLVHLPGAKVEAIDLTGGGDHWRVRVSAPQFEGLSLVKQHQAIYQALGSWVGREIHALAIDIIR